jgi:hypothetical protein
MTRHKGVVLARGEDAPKNYRDFSTAYPPRGDMGRLDLPEGVDGVEIPLSRLQRGNGKCGNEPLAGSLKGNRSLWIYHQPDYVNPDFQPYVFETSVDGEGNVIGRTSGARKGCLASPSIVDESRSRVGQGLTFMPQRPRFQTKSSSGSRKTPKVVCPDGWTGVTTPPGRGKVTDSWLGTSGNPGPGMGYCVRTPYEGNFYTEKAYIQPKQFHAHLASPSSEDGVPITSFDPRGLDYRAALDGEGAERVFYRPHERGFARKGIRSSTRPAKLVLSKVKEGVKYDVSSRGEYEKPPMAYAPSPSNDYYL